MSTDDDRREWDVASDEVGYIHQDTLDCWRINYGLNLTPHELNAMWEAGAPAGAVLALRCAVARIERLQVTLHHVECGLRAAEEERDELRAANDRFARRQAWWIDRI